MKYVCMSNADEIGCIENIVLCTPRGSGTAQVTSQTCVWIGSAMPPW